MMELMEGQTWKENQRYFADGLSEELLNPLARIPEAWQR